MPGREVEHLRHAVLKEEERDHDAQDTQHEWGPRTEDALKKFQSSNNMPSSGQLNANTITALGLRSSDFGVMGTSPQTTGQAPAGSNRQRPSSSEPNKGTNSH